MTAAVEYVFSPMPRMMTVVNDAAKIILLTGVPGCGKTTAIIGLADRLRGRRLAGFFTRELCERGQRVGFGVETFAGHRGVLSHVKRSSGPRVGRYRVDVAGFEAIALAELSRRPPDAEFFLIDEIGKMECFSQRFVQAVEALVAEKLPMVATIAAKGGGLIERIKRAPGAELIHVTHQTRDALPGQIAQRLLAG
jgi:nucleoside-triphosphatase